MKLIKKLGTKLNKNGFRQSWAEFLCEMPNCGKIIVILVMV